MKSHIHSMVFYMLGFQASRWLRPTPWWEQKCWFTKSTIPTGGQKMLEWEQPGPHWFIEKIKN